MALARPGRDAGFTLTEVMVVLVIVAVMATIAMPLAGRDKRANQSREYASTLARDLQRTRMLAVSERLPQRAAIYQDRVEFRSGTPGATEATAPTPPSLAMPPRETLPVRPEVSIFAVTGAAAIPGGQVLGTATPVEIEFAPTGSAQLVGAAPLTGAFIYIRHTGLSTTNPYRDFRIDVAPLTGFVQLRDRW
jgi:prepilin-type N-terminal cleavage/methylation domain-containing protein